MANCDEKRFAGLSAEQREYLMFAAEMTQAYLRQRPFSREALAVGANALTSLGFYAEGLALDRRLRELFPHDAGVAYNCACSQALTGDLEGAFATLEQAIELGYTNPQQLRKDPDWDDARDDPRFAQLLKLAEKHAAQ
jgi:adenylate cyclase